MNYGLQYLRPVSDIHLDFDVHSNRMPWSPKGLPTDHLTALVIAGDLWHSCKFLEYAGQSWLAKRAQSFRYIVFVLGNHDYWGGTINGDPFEVKKLIKEQNLKNVFLLERDCIVLEDVKFVGGTLWTDFNKQDPITRMMYKTQMSKDAKKIKLLVSHTAKDGQVVKDYRYCGSETILKEHLKTRDFIFEHAKKDANTRKLVVVTHYAPCSLSVHPDFAHLKIDNGYYYSDLGNQIADSSIDYWFHGHMHHSCEYEINNTKVIINPRGYVTKNAPEWANPTFNDQLLIQL